MKRQYMKPTMKVVKIHQPHLLCGSPKGMNGRTFSTYRDTDDKITNDDPDEIF